MEKVQISQKDMQKELTQDGMLDYLSDDDLASSLGFLTTMSEGMMNPMEPTDLQEEEPQEEKPENKEPQTEEAQEEEKVDAVDEAQQAEIDAIRAELEALKADNTQNDTGTETN